MPSDTTTVINRGRCGQNSTILRERFDADSSAGLPKPDHVLMYIGMNDVINDRFFTPLEVYLENLAWMLNRAGEFGIRAVVCTIHQVEEAEVYRHHARHHFGAETVNAKIHRYNVALRRLAANMRVDLADFALVAEKASRTALLSDGVHLTAAGNSLLADTFRLAVSPSLRDGETIVCLGDSLTYGFGNQGAGTSDGDTYPALLAKAIKDAG